VTIYSVISKDEDAREILTYCETPRSTDEIISHVYNIKRSKKPASCGDDQTVRTIVGSRLAKLESIKAIYFENNMWITSDTAKQILAKYFGL
jgi:hypothetical protein